MKILVVYKSKTGFTKQYAKWIAEELKADIYDIKEFSKNMVAQYDLVIYGGGFRGGKINGLEKIKAVFDPSDINKLVIFATGATPAGAKKTIDGMWKENLKGELGSTPHFYMPSGLNYEKMGAADRLLMKAFAKMLDSKKGKTTEEAETAKAIKSSYDISSREYIKPLVEYCRSRK